MRWCGQMKPMILAHQCGKEMHVKSAIVVEPPKQTHRHADDMKTPVILLLTNDPQLEETVAETLSANGGVSHLAYDPATRCNWSAGWVDISILPSSISTTVHMA
jgi:hypothetical protein